MAHKDQNIPVQVINNGPFSNPTIHFNPFSGLDPLTIGLILACLVVILLILILTCVSKNRLREDSKKFSAFYGRIRNDIGKHVFSFFAQISKVVYGASNEPRAAVAIPLNDIN